jgi:hypothetical protein
MLQALCVCVCVLQVVQLVKLHGIVLLVGCATHHEPCARQALRVYSETNKLYGILLQTQCPLTTSRVRSARQPLTITQHATAKVKDRNHGRWWPMDRSPS